MPFFRGPCPHPVSGIRREFPGSTVNANGKRWEQPEWPYSCSCLFFFYKYCVIRSPYSRINWLRTWSQFRYLWVHFFTTFSLARYRIFSSAVSLGNTLLVLVTFRYWRFSPSIIFVVLSRNRYSTTYADKKTIPTFPRIAVTTMPFWKNVGIVFYKIGPSTSI